MAKLGLILMAMCCFQDKMIDNPAYQSWKDSKPGTWVKIKMTISGGGQKMEMFATTKLIEVTADKAVTETSVEVMGQKQTSKKDIPAKVKEGAIYDLPEGAKFEKTAEGDEEIEVAGKKVKCHFFEGKFEQRGQTFTSKIHFSKDVIGGLAKGVMKGDQGDMTMDFVESGKE